MQSKFIQISNWESMRRLELMFTCALHPDCWSCLQRFIKSFKSVLIFLYRTKYGPKGTELKSTFLWKLYFKEKNIFFHLFSSTSHILDFIAGCLYRSGEIYYENIKKFIFFSQDTLHLKHFFCFSELCVEKGVWFLKIQFCKRFLSECPIIRM